LNHFSQIFFTIAFAFLALLVGGCGQVITKPTATVFIPSATPTPTRETATPTATPTTTPIPATPRPTDTPTPEPTPIIHTLQAGDTLIKLAREYGVSVEAIQKVNGITDPRGLLVGQQIIIPTDPEARLNAGTPTPEPTPPPIVISPLTFRERPDALWALGQVTLPQGDAVEDVILQVDLLDKEGKIIASAQAPIQLNMLAAGDVAGFGVRFSPPPQPFASYHSRIISAWPAHVAFYHRDLIIENILAQEAGESVYMLTGEVVNQGADPARSVKISVILYDEQGHVIAVRRVSADPFDLQPGERGFFSAALMPGESPVADYHIQAEGQRELSSND